MSEAVEARLRDAAKAIADDIRGAYKGLPQYRDYLVALLKEAATEIEELREQVPAPAPDPNEL